MTVVSLRPGVRRSHWWAACASYTRTSRRRQQPQVILLFVQVCQTCRLAHLLAMVQTMFTATMPALYYDLH